MRSHVGSLQRDGLKKHLSLPSPFRLTILLTFQCNLTCSHCLFECGPSQTECLSTPQVKHLIDQACGVSTIKSISFSGGEPFILGEELAEVVRYASRVGFDTECVTNSYWAKSESTAYKRLTILKDAGLSVISLSVDDFHQEQLPLRYVRNAYWAAQDLGLRVALITSTHRSGNLRRLKIKERIGDAQIHNARQTAGRNRLPQTILIQSAFMPAGRGANIPAEEREYKDELSTGPCTSILRDLSVLPSGRLLPCCSISDISQSGTTGTLFESSLPDLLGEMIKNPLFSILSRQGPAGLRKKLGHGPQRRYTSECHLCHELLSSHDSCSCASGP